MESGRRLKLGLKVKEPGPKGGRDLPEHTRDAAASLMRSASRSVSRHCAREENRVPLGSGVPSASTVKVGVAAHVRPRGSPSHDLGEGSSRR